MKVKNLILSLCCISTLATFGQSITIDPSSSSTINTSRGTNYIDINKTATNNTSGLRFMQNSVLQGGLFFNEDYNYFNLGNGPGTAGLVWNRGTQRVGVGTLSPLSKFHILTNSTGSIPHLLLQESTTTDGARINFENAGVENRIWTLFGRNSSSAIRAFNEFNIYHSEFGNVAQFFGDGNTKMNGFTQLGSDAPKIKTKKFTGIFPDQSSLSVSIDIPIHKIISYEILVQGSYWSGITYDIGNWLHGLFIPGGGNPNGCNYDVHIGGGLQFPQASTTSTNVLFSNIGNELRRFGDTPFFIYITYEE